MSKEKHLPSTLTNDSKVSVKGKSIKELAKEICERSVCHHKCRDTKDCIVEEEAELLINQNKSNNFEVKSNNELFKQALVEGLNRRFDKTIEEAKKIEQIEEMAVEFAKINCNPKGCYCCDLCDEYYSLELSCEDYLVYRKMAETFYNAGYRKQSEGEWTYSEDKRSMKCTHCRKRMKIQLDRRYCPNCGAKM